MKQWKTYSAFVRGLRGHSVEHQRKLIAAYVQQRGGRIVSEYTAGASGSDRDEWIKRVRSDEAAIVAGLFVIAEPAAKGRRPTADFARAMVSVISRAGVVICAHSGVSSTDGEAWEALIERDGVKVAVGRQLSRKRAQAMHRKSRERASPAVIAEWSAPNMRAELARWSQWWRDPQFPSALAAYEAMPDDVRERIGSLTTARRLFGRRRPGDPKAGGRPLKIKRKPK